MIFDFQDSLSRRLMLWSALSIAVGIILLIAGDVFWRGFGLQALVWGAIDAAIAFFGSRSASKRRATQPYSTRTFEREARNLRRLLWINTWLDVLYMAAGFAVLFIFGAQDAFAAGNGIGIVVQGSFLFLFDLLHVLAIPARDQPLALPNPFEGAEHAAFALAGGKPAVLLVHGFGGTPDEMRPLAEALNQLGYTAQAILLPGFGADMPTLLTRQHGEWSAAVSTTLDQLQAAGHEPRIVVGYSMGAAAALAATQTTHPQALVLIAPFMWDEPPWWQVLEFFVRPFLPLGFRPLRKADFSSPQLREGIGKFMPNLNLDDSATQQAMRDFRVPLSLIDQIRGLSRLAYAQAAKCAAPTLVIQGNRDDVVRTPRTRKLVAHFPQPPRYVEVDSAHDLTIAQNPAYPQVEAAVLDFARSISRHSAE